MSDAIDALRRELGAEPPETIAALGEGELSALAEALRTARQRQATALDDATEQGLSFVPRVLRGAVKKAVFG